MGPMDAYGLFGCCYIGKYNGSHGCYGLAGHGQLRRLGALHCKVTAGGDGGYFFSGFYALEMKSSEGNFRSFLCFSKATIQRTLWLNTFLMFRRIYDEILVSLFFFGKFNIIHIALDAQTHGRCSGP